ncbi:MAG: hypothetical protein JJU21_07040 [Salinarimonas sp.]|nr:hypothetical protein [Salinarimonas sp.]
MIIHFIGVAGSGKSALANTILSARADLLPRSNQDKAALHWRAMLRLFLPRYSNMGRELAAYNNAQGKTAARLWAHKLAVEGARRQLGGSWIVHHGFTNTMRKKSSPIDPGLARRLPFPEVIVNIGAVPAVRVARVSKRNKSPHKTYFLNSDDRQEAVRRRARQWLQIWSEEVVFDYLTAFNFRHCRPLLDEVQLRRLLVAEKGASLDEADLQALTYKPLHQSYAWLKDVFEAHGGTWIDFENSGISDLQAAAASLLARLPIR